MKKGTSALIMGLMTVIFLLAAAVAALPGKGLRVNARAADASAIMQGGNEKDAEPDILMPGERVNINTASKEELMRLPGIGETLSERIIARRESAGTFESIEELMDVDGIGSTRFAAIEEYVIVEDSK